MKQNQPPQPPPVSPVSFISRCGLALLVAVLYAGVIVWFLSRPATRDITRPLEGWSPDNPAFLAAHTRVQSVPLARQPLADAGWVHSINLAETGILPGSGLRSIGMKFDVAEENGSEPAQATAVRGSLTNHDGSRHFECGVPRLIQTEDLYLFQSAPPEAAVAGPAQSADWTLSIVTKEPVRIRLRCHATPENEIQLLSTNIGCFAAILGARRDKGRFAYPHGLYILSETAPVAARGAMAAWTWGWRSTATPWCWIAAAGALLGLAAIILPIGQAPNSLGWPIRTAAGAGMAFAAFGLTHLVVTPPFFGTDEGAHFFSYTTWMRDGAMEARGKAEGLRLHVSRLLARPEQKLTPHDRVEPWWWFIDNPATMDTRPMARSATAAHLWARSRGWVEDSSPLDLLFELRLLSLGVASLGIAWAAAVLAWVAPLDERSPWLGWTPLLIPSLPYLAMNFSNYPVLYGGMAVLMASAAALLLTPRRPWWLGLTFGGAAGFVFHTSQSALPAAAFVVLALGAVGSARMLGPDSDSSQDRLSYGFWIWLALGLVAARCLTTPEFDAETRIRLAAAGPALNGATALGYNFMAALFAASGLGLEAVAAQLRGRFSERPGADFAKLGFLGAFLLIGGLGFNAVHRTPRLEPLQEIVPTWEFVPNQRLAAPSTDTPLQSPTPTPAAYSKSALSAILGSFGPGGHDFMTSRLFWTITGYLDPLGPELWISVLSVFFGAGLALLCLEFASIPDGERIWLLLGLIAGLMLYAALMAAGAAAAAAKPSLHGRYLTGFYLGILTLGFLGWRRVAAAGSARWPRFVAAAALLLPVAHQLSMHYAELERYYGS
jgi:hypothetical protein